MSIKDQAILFMFDLDGTLIDTSNIIIKSLIKTINIYSPTKTNPEHLGRLFKASPYQIIKEYTGSNNMKQKMKKYWEYYKKVLSSEVKVYPNISKMLIDLKKKNHGIVVVTSLISYIAKKLINNYLKFKFDVIVAYHDTPRHKPYPDPIILAIEKYKKTYHIEEVSALYIGDTKKDILAGKNACILTGLAAWNLNDKEIAEIQNIRPNYIFKDPLDLLKIKI